MNDKDELVHRCMDNDLDDAELKSLFTAMGKSEQLRNEFRSILQLRQQLQVLESPPIPASLDHKISALSARPKKRWSLNIPPIRNIIVKRIPVPAFVVVAAALLLLLGSVFAIEYPLLRRPSVQYVYVYELQPVVVQSYYVQ